MTDWADDLTGIAITWRSGTSSIRDLFTRAAPPEGFGPDEFHAAVSKRLVARPELVAAWQTYSYDKRSSLGPYLDGTKVGFYDSGRGDAVRVHRTATDACADFLYRETNWVLFRRVVPAGS